MSNQDKHIWCTECRIIQPLIRDYMPADAKNFHASTDLLCGECRFIIATVHHMDDIEPREASNAG